MIRSSFGALLFLLSLAAVAKTAPAESSVWFHARTAHSGRWSDPKTWIDRHIPKPGDSVQIRPGHTVVYDVDSDHALRTLHVAGRLTFAREKSTRLNVGLLKIAPGETISEDGFNCHEVIEMPDQPNKDNDTAIPALEIGTAENPIPAKVTTTIRLVYFDGMDSNALPAVVNCGGRWDVHGAPLSRTWVKLGNTVKPGDAKVTLAEAVTGWKVGDRIIVTVSKENEEGNSYRQSSRKPKRVETEERFIAAINGLTLIVDKPLSYEHFGTGDFRSEVANLSRNVVIESANPDGIRGHTMYHRHSSGGISYAEFRHLGKEGLLGKYSIHFHLVRDTMRGSGVIGASIWDSRNRWITIHGTDYLLVRDCVGYQSVGHGFFLEDGTEQYNVLDRNLAVQAYKGKRLPKQVLPFDANDGAGFWWANGRNTLVRNVACENDEYGFRFEIAKRSDFNPVLSLRTTDGQTEPRDVRTVPFYRFDQNESHSEGLYSFNFGDDTHASVHGDRKHPFIATRLIAWETHYAIRPNVQFFLLDGLRVHQAAYGVYHPEYDAQVFRNVYFTKVNGEPINRGHDDESIQYGTFTYENLTLENCRGGRDPLIQMACTAPQPGQSGHFRNLVLKNSNATVGKVVDLGGGPRNPRLVNPVAYYFHDNLEPGRATKIMSAKYELPEDFHTIDKFTGKDVRAANVTGIEFPELVDPIDDLPPATQITSVRKTKGKLLVRGVSHDNGEIVTVLVNGQRAKLSQTQTGLTDWEILLDHATEITARATDRAGNKERHGHKLAPPQ